MRTPLLSWINKHNVTEVHIDSFHSCIYYYIYTFFSYFCATLNDFINNTSDMRKTMVSRKLIFTQAMYKLRYRASIKCGAPKIGLIFENPVFGLITNGAHHCDSEFILNSP